MHIDKFKSEDGGFVFSDGCHYDDAESLLQSAILGFCGCGRPDINLAFIRDGLAHIDDKHEQYPDLAWDAYYEQWVASGVAIFGSARARDFFFYWADKEGLTEHGGSIPGWLTEKGRELLDDLNELCGLYGAGQGE